MESLILIAVGIGGIIIGVIAAAVIEKIDNGK